MKAITQKHVEQIDTTARAEMIDSIIWFGFNYNYNFIEECWSDDPCLANHLKGKFNLLCNNFTDFISMLCDGHREKLYNYILERFSKSKGHFKI